MNTRWRLFVSKRVQLLMGSALLLLGVACLGLLLGQARARAITPGTDRSALIAQDAAIVAARQLDDGVATVTIDEATNQVCVEARVGQGTGSACNAIETAEPWLFLTGGDAGGPTMVVAVDGRRRLGSLLVGGADGEVIARSEDGGLSIQVLLAEPPTDLVMLGRDETTVLGSQRPRDEVRAGQQQAETAPLEPESE